MARAYTDLHELGHGHSVEIWQGNKLVGGVYGLAIGAVFFGESMFSLIADGSKFALAALAIALENRDFALIDCQVGSPHLETLGCSYMPRREFLEVLNVATAVAFPPANWRDWPMNSSELLATINRR
jgi:leucyl/phenylalanyl-tRNA--protein transferase